MSNENPVNWCNCLWSDLQAAIDDLETNADNELSSITINGHPVLKAVLFPADSVGPSISYYVWGPPANKSKLDEMQRRFLSARDIFTGEPLAAADINDWGGL